MRIVWLALICIVCFSSNIVATTIHTNQINFAPTLNRTHNQTIALDDLSNVTVTIDPSFSLLTSGGGIVTGDNLSWVNVTEVSFVLESPNGCTEGDVYRMPVYINHTFFNFFTYICIPDNKIVDYKAEYGHGDSNYLDDGYRYLPAENISLFNLIRVYTYGSYFNPNEDGYNASITCQFPNYLVMTRQKNHGTNIYHHDDGVNATFYWTNLFGNWFRVAPLEQEITGLDVGDTYNISCNEMVYSYSTGDIRANFDNVSFEIRSTSPLTATATADNSSKDNYFRYVLTNEEKYPIYDVELMWKTDNGDAYYENLKTIDVNETVAFQVFVSGSGNLSLDASFVPIWQRDSLKPRRYTQLWKDEFTFEDGEGYIDRVVGDDNITALISNVDEIAEKVFEPEIEVFGTDYEVGDNGRIFASITQNDEYVNNASCKVDVDYPESVVDNNSLFVEDGYMTSMGYNGLYYYDVIMPEQIGIYMVTAICEIGGTTTLYNMSSDNITNGSVILGDLSKINKDDDNYYVIQSNTSYKHEFTSQITLDDANLTSNYLIVNFRGYSTGDNNLTISIYNFNTDNWINLSNSITPQTATTDVSVSQKISSSPDYFNSGEIKIRISGGVSTLYIDKLEVGATTLPTSYDYKTAGSEMNVRERFVELNNSINEVHSQLVSLNLSGTTPGYGLARLTDVERVIGSQDYTTELTIYDDYWNWVTPDDFPMITIYDPDMNKLVDNQNMYVFDGIYRYDYTIAYGSVGLYTTEVKVNVSGEEITLFDKWTLISNPTEVTVDVISKCEWEVCADITITNEGYENFEYIYYWWTSDEHYNDYDEGYDKGQASKLLKPGESYTKTVCLDTPRTDNLHYFRAKTYYGDYSFATDSYDNNDFECKGTFLQPVTGMSVRKVLAGDLYATSMTLLVLLSTLSLGFFWIYKEDPFSPAVGELELGRPPTQPPTLTLK